MAKAKTKKPARQALPNQAGWNRIAEGRLNDLAARLDMLVETTNDALKQIDSLDKAICPRVAARLTALERHAMSPAERAVPLSPYERSYRDVMNQKPERTGSALQPGERYLVTNLLAIAQTRMSRAARHELIVRLTDLNRSG